MCCPYWLMNFRAGGFLRDHIDSNNFAVLIDPVGQEQVATSGSKLAVAFTYKIRNIGVAYLVFIGNGAHQNQLILVIDVCRATVIHLVLRITPHVICIKEDCSILFVDAEVTFLTDIQERIAFLELFDGCPTLFGWSTPNKSEGHHQSHKHSKLFHSFFSFFSFVM